jgi:hypothetical protein
MPKPLLALVVIAGAASTAQADPTVWDRTYKHSSAGGEWMCPHPASDVVVKDGQFSLPWEVTIKDDVLVTIGYIEGTVRPSGIATSTVRFLEPLPPAFVKTMRDWNESLGELRKREPKVKFLNNPHQPREIDVNSGNCYAYWKEDRSAMKVQSGAPLDCTTGAYAVAAWNAKRAYKLGELAQVWTAGQPTRVWRCVDACSAGISPTAEGDDYGDDTWALVGECRGGAKAPPPKSEPDAPAPEALAPLKPPKMGPGSPKWDTTYSSNMNASQDWRCPAGGSLDKLVISKGSFSIPWKIRTNYGSDDIGVIAGSIKDDGTVTIAATATATELSPELLESNRKATLVNLRAFKQPTMKFILDTGKMNPKGQGRRTELSFGKECEYELRASDYKPQQFLEKDGWRVSCPRDLVWSSRDSYKRGELATIINADGGRGKYQCEASKHCDAGVRPDRSEAWRRIGRCE